MYTRLYPKAAPDKPWKDFSFEGVPRWALNYDSERHFISTALRTLSKTNYQYTRTKANDASVEDLNQTSGVSYFTNPSNNLELKKTLNNHYSTSRF